MKKSYYYLAVAMVTAFTATASADQAPWRQRGPYGQPRYAQDEEQPLPRPPEDQQQSPDTQQPGPCQGCDPRIGQFPGVNVQGNGNTVIVQIAPDGTAARAIAPQGCYNAYSCQALIGQLQYQALAPQWGCGYQGCNVPTYFNDGVGQYPLYQNYAHQGYRYFVYNQYGTGNFRPAYGFYPQFRPQVQYAPGYQRPYAPQYQPGLRYPARRLR